MDDTKKQQRIAENWARVSESVATSAAQASRNFDDVKVIGVTKYVDAATTAMLFDAGCASLGESRPQLLWQKAESTSHLNDVDWHMIGHVQRNKIRRLIRHCRTIHSVDSARLLEKIRDEAIQASVQVSVLLEVNVSGEASKTGMDALQLREAIDDYLQWPDAGRLAISLRGLMAMAGRGTNDGEAREQFSEVRELRDKLVSHSGLSLPELSMGMSGDYAAAISQGSTMVRIGSALFDGVLPQ